MSGTKIKKPRPKEFNVIPNEATRGVVRNLNLKKINRLRKAIREGRYEINFEKLAEKILEKCKIA